MLKRRPKPVDVRLMGEAVLIKPGDTLLVRVPAGYTAEDCRRIKDALRGELLGVSVCVVSGTDSVHVYRPDSV